MNQSKLKLLRQNLVNKLNASHFIWYTVSLASGVSIKICEPVKVDGYYLPVTAEETFKIAKRFLYYPLTRAVVDQIQNKALFVPYAWQPELFDFPKYSSYLHGKNYNGVKNFGAHKLWVLSKRRGAGKTKAVNYGFYEIKKNQAPGTLNHGGANLDPTYNSRQGLGGVHDDHHWDYSQLLQLMYSTDPLTIDGEKISLSMALKAGKSLVTDEGGLTDDDLP